MGLPLPRTSLSRKPKIFSDTGFHEVTRPSRSKLTTAFCGDTNSRCEKGKRCAQFLRDGEMAN